MPADSSRLSRKPISARLIHLAAFVFYLAVAIGITWPLVTVMATRFAGFGYSDAYEMAHHIWWFKYALQHGQPLFFQTLMGYPTGIDGITLWSNVLQFFPAWLLAFVLPLPVASNVMILITLALDGWAMYWLARELTGRQTGPALLAGVVFMAFPTLQGHLGAAHAGLLVQWPLPLFALALLRLRASGQRRYIALGALFFIMTTWGHSLQVIFTLMPVTAIYTLVLLLRREWRALGQTILTVLIAGVIFGLFLIPVVRATLGTAAYVEEGGAVRYSADLLALVTPSFFHPIFGQWEYTHRVLGINLDEGAAYYGIVAALLTLIALWKRPAARWWLAVAALAYLLSLGPLLKLFDQPVVVTVGSDFPTNVTLPWAAVGSLPFFNLARTPGRFNFALALAAAALAAYGASVVWTRLNRRALRWPVLVAALGLILFEYQTFWPLPLTTANIPDQIRDLATRSDVRAVFDSPWSNLVVAKEGLYLQTGHVHPLIAGQVTRQTPVDPAKLTVLEATYNPALLREAGADVVIVHRKSDDGALEDRATAQLGEPIYRGDRFSVFLTPQTTGTPPFIAIPPTVTSIEDRAAAYVYAPSDGWARLRATLAADGRDVALTLDGREWARWTVDGTQSVDLPLPLTRGYHTVALTVRPACPVAISPALRCRAVGLSDFALDDYEARDLGAQVAFDHDLRLTAARVDQSPDQALNVALAWQMDAPRSEQDIRFVHVLDASGQLVAQDDRTLGALAADVTRVESLSLALPSDLAPGAYRVTVGWYTYPDNTRFVVSDSDSGEVEIGTFTLP